MSGGLVGGNLGRNGAVVDFRRRAVVGSERQFVAGRVNVTAALLDYCRRAVRAPLHRLTCRGVSRCRGDRT